MSSVATGSTVISTKSPDNGALKFTHLSYDKEFLTSFHSWPGGLCRQLLVLSLSQPSLQIMVPCNSHTIKNKLISLKLEIRD